MAERIGTVKIIEDHRRELDACQATKEKGLADLSTLTFEREYKMSRLEAEERSCKEAADLKAKMSGLGLEQAFNLEMTSAYKTATDKTEQLNEKNKISADWACMSAQLYQELTFARGGKPYFSDRTQNEQFRQVTLACIDRQNKKPQK